MRFAIVSIASLLFLSLASPAVAQTAEEVYQGQVDAAMAERGQPRVDGLKAAIASGLVLDHQTLAVAAITAVKEELLLEQHQTAYTDVKTWMVGLSGMTDEQRLEMMTLGFRAAGGYLVDPDLTNRRIELLIIYIDTFRLVDLPRIRTVLLPFVDQNDAIRLFLADDVKTLIADDIRIQRQQTGRIDRTRVDTLMAKVVNNQGDAIYSATWPVTTSLASNLLDSEQSVFVGHVLVGEYPQAAQKAYDLAVASLTGDDPDTELYAHWMRMAARTIRTHDQHYNGRTLMFFDWINGEIADNPVPDLITE